MKFLYFTDVHLFGSPVPHRKDNYLQSIYSKLETIISLGKDNNIDAFLFGGDLFHIPEPSTAIVNQTLSIFNRMKVVAPVFGVLGSHDVYGKSTNTISRVSIGTLIEADVLQLLTEVPTQFGDSYLCGFSHTSEAIPNLYVAKSSHEPLVELIHHSVVPAPVPWDHILVSDLNTEADVVLCGHYHNPFTVSNKDQVIINPGSLGRLENTTGNRDRLPSAVLISVAPSKKTTYLVVPVIDQGNVFKDITPYVDGSIDLALNQLFTSLKTGNGEISTQDPLAVVEAVATSSNIDSHIKDITVHLIQTAMRRS